MGRDKASLPFGNETMLQRMVRIVGDATDQVMLVRREDDPIADLGPLAGMAQGLRMTSTDLNFIVACDMPLLRPAVIRRLIDLSHDCDACVPVDGDVVMVLCGVYRKHLADEATQLINTGQRRARALLEHGRTKKIEAAMFRDLDPELESFFSCDTPEAYQQALVRIGSGARRSPDA